MFFSRRRGLALFLGLVALSVLVPGCSEYGSRRIDVASIEDVTPITPDTPLILPLNAQNQVKLYDHWYDIYGDTAQIDEYLSRKARRYKVMYQEHGIERDQRMVNGECLLVYPVEVIIEPQVRTKMGAVSRLTRICNEHGFYKVSVRREGEEERVGV